MKLLVNLEVDKNSCKYFFFPRAWHKYQEDLVAPSSPIPKQTEQNLLCTLCKAAP